MVRIVEQKDADAHLVLRNGQALDRPVAQGFLHRGRFLGDGRIAPQAGILHDGTDIFVAGQDECAGQFIAHDGALIAQPVEQLVRIGVEFGIERGELENPWQWRVRHDQPPVRILTDDNYTK